MLSRPSIGWCVTGWHSPQAVSDTAGHLPLFRFHSQRIPSPYYKLTVSCFAILGYRCLLLPIGPLVLNYHSQLHLVGSCKCTGLHVHCPSVTCLSEERTLRRTHCASCHLFCCCAAMQRLYHRYWGVGRYLPPSTTTGLVVPVLPLETQRFQCRWSLEPMTAIIK